MRWWTPNPNTSELSPNDEYNNYNSLLLKNIQDYQNYPSLWTPSPGLFSRNENGIQGMRLLGALEKRKDKGKAFSDVIVYIPSSTYDDLITKGRVLQDMALALEELHRKDFTTEEARYVVLPNDMLKEQTLLFVFGKCVYFPKRETKQLFSCVIEIGEKVFPGAWARYDENGNVIGGTAPIPIGIFEGQSVINIGIENCSFVVPKSFWGNRPEKNIEIFTSDVLGNGLRIKEQFHQLSKEKETTIEIGDADHPNNLITLKFTPTAPVVSSNDNAPKESDKGTFNPGKQPINTSAGEEFTFFGQKDRKQPARLVVEAILLPRLDTGSLYTSAGSVLQEWRLWFDKDGQLFQQKPKDPAEIYVTMSACSKNDTVYYRYKSDENPRTLNTSLDIGIHKADFSDQELAQRFLVMIKNNGLGSLVLNTEKSITLGRRESNNAPNSSNFCLNQLNIQGCMTLGDESIDSNLDKVYTSRDHVEITLNEDNKLNVSQLSKTNSIYILDAENKLIEEIAPDPIDDEQRVKTLQNGQKLIIGNYLLRFEESSCFSNSKDSEEINP